VKRKTVLIAAGISVVVSGALVVRVIAIEKLAVMVILLPAIVGAILALWRPEDGGILAAAVSLTALTAVVSLIGGVGLLYVPSMILWVWCVVPTRAQRTSHSRSSVPTETIHDCTTSGHWPIPRKRRWTTRSSGSE
jgi:hypothetical protein